MSRLLYVESSPRKDRSKSIEVANSFLDAYRSFHPDDEIATRDLWSAALPEFDGYTIDAKYQVLHGESFDDQQSRAWQAVVDVCDAFKDADKYVFSVPMWNFGVPYKLKHYFDVIAQPGQTFSFDPASGYSGLVTGKPAVVISARGGSYEGDASAMDHQKTYVEQMLGFFGFVDIHHILVNPTLASPDDVAETIEHAKQQAVSLAESI
ncbi:MAG: NAD(P)H-dependent oxidoreductase [Planctomycetota bacterium]